MSLTDRARNEPSPPEDATGSGLSDTPQRSHGSDGHAPTHLDDYLIQKLKHIRLQVAEREAELVCIHRVRDQFSAALVGILEYAKNMYSSSTGETEILVNAYLVKLIDLLSTAQSNIGDGCRPPMRKPSKPR